MAGTSPAMTARPITLITGASSGIGVELARIFARDGFALALVARRVERLNKLADEIEKSGQPRPLVISADLARSGATRAIADALNAAGVEPQYIVNNAGFGLVGQAAKLDRAEQLEIIDVNARALTELSLSFVDSLERHKGGILNVGSVAGFLPGPGSAVYYASKAYVLSFSEALYAELKPRGIKVCVLCPGPVPTEFAERAGVKSKIAPGLLVQSAQDVAEAGYRGFMDGHRVVVPGFANRLVMVLARILPRRIVLGLVGRRQSQRTSTAEKP